MLRARTVVIALGLGVLSLAACERSRDAAPAPKSSASVAPTASLGSAPSASARAEPALDPDVVCRDGAGVEIPRADLPSEAQRAELQGCDPGALYYGVGVPIDYERARQCAYVDARQQGSAVVGGPEILMMIYANARGVSRSFDLALRFACEVGGARKELESRVSRLWNARERGKLDREMDICDDVTSGYMSGHCAAHRERMAALPREARRLAAVAEMPAGQVAALDKAAAHYFRTRSAHEIDLTGTMRAVYGIEEQARLEEQLVKALERLRDPSFPGAVGDSTALDAELGATLNRISHCKSYAELEKLGLPGAVTRVGIRRAHDAWLPFRSAFVALAVSVRRESQPHTWRAWLSAERLQLLQELANGC
jgi:hypothetical protein